MDPKPRKRKRSVVSTPEPKHMSKGTPSSECEGNADAKELPAKQKPVHKKTKKKKHARTEHAPVVKESPVGQGTGEKRKRKAQMEKLTSQEDRTVIIGGLPFTSTEAILAKDFAECGKVQKINLPKDKQTWRIRGFAFITFATKEGAVAALKFDGKEYNGRRINSKMAGTKPDSEKPSGAMVTGKINGDFTVFVAGLPHSITQKSLRKYFSESGDIENLKLPLNDEGQAKGFAFITYRDKHSLTNALKLNGNDLDGRSIVVRMSGDGGDKGKKGSGKGKIEKGSGKSFGNPELTLFVSGFPYFTTEAEIKNKFVGCGEITQLKLPMCDWDESQSRGFAFISFKDRAATERALALDGNNLKDRHMSVKRLVDHEQAVNMRKLRQERHAGSDNSMEQSHQDKEEAKPGESKKKSTTDILESLLTDRERGVLVKPTGTKVVFESDDE